MCTHTNDISVFIYTQINVGKVEHLYCNTVPTRQTCHASAPSKKIATSQGSTETCPNVYYYSKITVFLKFETMQSDTHNQFAEKKYKSKKKGFHFIRFRFIKFKNCFGVWHLY